MGKQGLEWTVYVALGVAAVRREELAFVCVGIRDPRPAASGPFGEARHRVDSLVALREAEEAARARSEAKPLLGRRVGKVRFALLAAVRCVDGDRKKCDKEHPNLSCKCAIAQKRSYSCDKTSTHQADRIFHTGLPDSSRSVRKSVIILPGNCLQHHVVHV
jgi:hypothetical protein